MIDVNPRKLKERFDTLKKERGTLEGEWRMIAKLMGDPRDTFTRYEASSISGRFQQHQRARGRFDDTGEDALDNFVGGMFANTVNPATPWFALSIQDTDLAAFQPVKAYLDAVTKLVRRTFEPSASAFYQWIPETLADAGLFGQAVQFNVADPARGKFIDKAIPLAQCYFDVDDENVVDTMFRPFSMKQKNILATYGDDALTFNGRAPDAKDGDKMHSLLQVVLPNPELERGKLGVAGQAFVSIVMHLEKLKVLQQKGFHEFPFSVLRLGKIRGTYARGLGQKALSGVKGVNSMRHDTLKSGNMAADPMVLLKDENAAARFKKRPGGVIVGGMNHAGKALADTLDMSGNLPFTLEMVEREREEIREKFLFKLFSILSSNRTGLSPEEFLAEEQRRLQLMGPMLTQVQVPFLNPIVLRRYQQLKRFGLLPEMPTELQGHDIEVVMESAMARSQKVSEGNSSIRLLQAVGLAEQFDPGISDYLDLSSYPAIMQSAFGAPAALVASERTLVEKRTARQQAQAAEQALAASEAVATIDEKSANAALARSEARS